MRLDDPVPHLLPAGVATAATEVELSTQNPAHELPRALARVRLAFAAAPSSSPADIVQRARLSSHADDDNRHPPIPPPLIRLDPEPRPSRDGLLTPFLLHALFLGASALGLLARRKVCTPEKVQSDAAQRTAERERQAAEDRIDELQALDLLVSVCAVPESTGVKVDGLQWREEQLRSVTKLVGRIDAAGMPITRQRVASIVHFVSFEPPRVAGERARAVPPSSKYSLARPVLGLWAWRAYESLPTAPSSSSTPDPLDAPLLGAFLSLLYPPKRIEADRFFFARSLSSTTDRQILNAVATRVLAEGYSPSRGLVAAFANAAIRARRVDLLETLVIRHADLDPKVRLIVVTGALRLLAENVLGRRDPERAARWAARFVEATKQLPAISLREVGDVEVALRRMEDKLELEHDVLAPYVADAVTALLESSQQEAVLAGTVVLSALRHLLRNGEAHHAQRIFDAVPPAQRSLAHFEALLKFPDVALARHTWRALAVHPTLQPTFHFYDLYFATLAKPSTPGASSSTRLRLAYRAFLSARRAASSRVPLARLWHAFLRVCAAHAPEPQLRVLLSRMEHDDGVAPDERTAAALVAREMRREDAKTRRKAEVVVGPRGEREVERVERDRRRGGGKAQMRRVRDKAREWSRRVNVPEAAAQGEGDVEVARAGPNAPQPDLDRLVLQDALRWRREYTTDKLVVLARARLGIDLAALVPEGSRQIGKAAPPPAHALEPAAWHREREPALKLFVWALEHRGRDDLAGAVAEVLRDEAAQVRRTELRQRKERRTPSKEAVSEMAV